MLSPADAALVARDPAVTGMAVLLDQDAFVAALRSAFPALAATAAAATYVRYKPGTSCLVAYRLAAAGKELAGYACAYAVELRPKLRHARRLAREPGALGIGALVIEGLDVAVYSWPHDRRLPALAQLEERGGLARLLAALCPARPDLGTARPERLRHRPERRYVGRLAGAAGGDAVIKLYDEADFGAARAAAAAFRPSGPLRLAVPLGSSDLHRALLFPWLGGRPLAGVWGPAALRATGAALGALHCQPAPGLARDAAAALPGELAAAARAVATICPDLAARAGRLADDLHAALSHKPAPPRPIHGDFYADQVLVCGGDVALLDLDRAGWGEPAADIGNFLAHLWRGVLAGALTSGQVRQLMRSLCEGYAAVAPLPEPRRIALHGAAGLLRLAPEPFRYRAPGWPLLTARLVAAVEMALGGQILDAIIAP